MSDPDKIIFDFLQSFEPEVSGRSTDPIPDELRAKMRLFAQGKLSEFEQQELQKLLAGKPKWIAALAEEVKALRP